MTGEEANIVCTKYNLKSVIKLPTKVTGGLIHKMWMLETETGNYAVKELNAEIMLRPGLIQNMNRCEKIAKQFKTLGVEAIPALESGKEDNFVSKIHDKFFIVYPWIEGTVLTDSDLITVETAKKIASVLAKIHKSNLQFDTPNIIPSNINYATWLDLKTRIEFTDFSWKKDCIDFILHMKDWINFDLVNTSITNLQNTIVLSHRDLDKKNVIWTEQSIPQIIDWESAGYTNPLVELVRLAFDWSSEPTGETNELIFREIFKSYTISNDVDKNLIKDALYFSLVDNISWLEFNLNRILSNSSNDEKEIAHIQIPQTIKQITSRLNHLEEYLSWVLT